MPHGCEAEYYDDMRRMSGVVRISYQDGHYEMDAREFDERWNSGRRSLDFICEDIRREWEHRRHNEIRRVDSMDPFDEPRQMLAPNLRVKKSKVPAPELPKSKKLLLLLG